ncbi:conserved hypothetical protein [Desulfurococcaceae archaeon AG1]|jgi:hypothetical protein|nr:MAG: hypothetical protein DJ555_04090 [Desulfurococcaceae archaeon]GAY26088.1 conserved hypothetical protein [Desulfurococcaceae archaeon AG1]
MGTGQGARILTTRVRGKGYSFYHAVKLLDLLSIKGPLGRALISRELGIGEGSSRSLVRCLRSSGLIETDPVGGSYLTDKGYEVLARWRGIITGSICVKERLDPSPWDLISVSCLHESRSGEVLAKGILNIRDTIVRSGCLGAMIIGVKGGEVYILDTAGRPDINMSRTPLGARILDLCGGKDGTLVIVSSSDSSCLDAERCVWETVAALLGTGEIIKEISC